MKNNFILKKNTWGSLLLIFTFLFSTVSFGQKIKPLALEVQNQHTNKTIFTNIDHLLSIKQDNQLLAIIEKEVRDAQIFNYDQSLAMQIINIDIRHLPSILNLTMN